MKEKLTIADTINIIRTAAINRIALEDAARLYAKRREPLKTKKRKHKGEER